MNTSLETAPPDNPPSMLWMGCFGSVSLYPLSDGTAEVLWSSELFGYGRYIVGTPRYAKAYALSRSPQPLWEQLQGQAGVKLPIIDTEVNANPVPSDGRSGDACVYRPEEV